MGSLWTWRSYCPIVWVSGWTPLKRERSPSWRSSSRWVYSNGLLYQHCPKFPERHQDMLDYLALIVQVHMDCEGDSGLSYDHRFHQMVADTPRVSHAKNDPMLWDVAFTGHAKVQHCEHCFSLIHVPTPLTQPSDTIPTAYRLYPHSCSCPLCYSRNYSPDTCSKAPIKDHNALHCPSNHLK